MNLAGVPASLAAPPRTVGLKKWDDTHKSDTYINIQAVKIMNTVITGMECKGFLNDFISSYLFGIHFIIFCERRGWSDGAMVRNYQCRGVLQFGLQ